MANHHGHTHHHEHHLVPASLNKIFIFCIALNLLFVVIEAGVGFIYNSLGLLSDAGHNLSDVFSLLLALIAFRMAKLHATHHFTYGYKKATILISLVNAVILLVAVGAILIESIYKLKHPEPVSGEAITRTGIGRSHQLDSRHRYSHQRTDNLAIDARPEERFERARCISPHDDGYTRFRRSCYLGYPDQLHRLELD